MRRLLTEGKYFQWTISFQVLHRDCKIKDMTGKPMRAMDVFALCIKYLKDTMIEAMKQKITFDIEDKNIDFVITVPAIWGDAAKLFMREAAINVRWL